MVNELEKTSVAGVDVKDEVSSLLDINTAKYFDITTGTTATGGLTSFKYFTEPVQLERLVEEFEEEEGLEVPESKLTPLEDLDLDININGDNRAEFEEYESSEEVRSENLYPDQDVDDVDDVIEDLEAFQQRIAVSGLDEDSHVTAEDSVFAELADAERDAATNGEAFQGTVEEAVFAELKDAEITQETRIEEATEIKTTDDAAVEGKEEEDDKKD